MDNYKDVMKFIETVHSRDDLVTNMFGVRKPGEYKDYATTGPYMGIEIEIENLPRVYSGELDAEGNPQYAEWYGAIMQRGFPGWSLHEDNSLKDCGVEFVSVPTLASDLVPRIVELFKELPIDTAAFSDRAGIHIHVDVTRLTNERLSILSALYLSVEPVFFAMCADHRRNNIFCVEHSEWLTSNTVINPYGKGAQKLSKYSAYNLCPVQRQGTVEFRHFESTKDLNKISLWIEAIKNLHNYATTTEKSLQQVLLELLHMWGDSQFLEHIAVVLGYPALEYARQKLGEESLMKAMNKAVSRMAHTLLPRQCIAGSQLEQYL